jgi:hypothetical protein
MEMPVPIQKCVYLLTCEVSWQFQLTEQPTELQIVLSFGPIKILTGFQESYK